MSDLTCFRLARIAEDEAAARAATRHADHNDTWSVNGAAVWAGQQAILIPAGMLWDPHNILVHTARWDPAHVLAECEAKRRIVAVAQAYRRTYVQRPGPYEAGRHEAGDVALRLLSLPDAAHPDYRPEWRP